MAKISLIVFAVLLAVQIINAQFSESSFKEPHFHLAPLHLNHHGHKKPHANPNKPPKPQPNKSLQLLDQLATSVMKAISSNNLYITQVSNGGPGNLTLGLKVSQQLMTIFQDIQADITSNQQPPAPVAPAPVAPAPVAPAPVAPAPVAPAPVAPAPVAPAPVAPAKA